MIPPKAIEAMQKFGEADVLINEVVSRFKKGLYSLVLVNGLPGTGKSYLSLRLKEILDERIKTEFNTEPQNKILTINSLLELVKGIRQSNPGNTLIIEELSVLFPSKRAMSSENVDVGKVLDTVRKKQLILLSNAPVLPHIDNHIRAMANYLVETKRIDKKQKLTLSKVLRLQTNPRSGQTYFHTLTRSETGKEVHYFVTRKPSEDTCLTYEKEKDSFLDDLYKKLEDKHQKKTDKENKQAMITTRVVAPVPGADKLTLKQREAVELYKQGLTYVEIGKRLGISPVAAKDRIIFARNKVFIVEKEDVAANNLTLNKQSKEHAEYSKGGATT